MSTEWEHLSIDLGDKMADADQYVELYGFGMGPCSTYGVTDEGAEMGEATFIMLEVTHRQTGDQIIPLGPILLSNENVARLRDLCELRLGQLGEGVTIDLTEADAEPGNGD